MSTSSETERQVIRHFDHCAEYYAANYSDGSLMAHFFTSRQEKIHALLREVPAGKILDVGCGPGMMTEHCLSRGFEFFGVDISQGMITLCNERFGHLPPAHFSVGRVQRLHFPNDCFDVALCMGVLEYVDDAKSAIAELRRVLKPGGLLLISCLNDFSPYWVWDRLDRKIQALPPSHRTDSPRIRMFRAAAVERLLRLHNLAAVDLVYYSFNLVPPPLDREFPRRSVQLSRKLERLCGTHLKWLGMAFIISARKDPAATSTQVGNGARERPATRCSNVASRHAAVAVVVAGSSASRALQC
jgi:ubiquinone/menaquinone biosynthesis C-methylase UbiE